MNLTFDGTNNDLVDLTMIMNLKRDVKKSKTIIEPCIKKELLLMHSMAEVLLKSMATVIHLRSIASPFTT